MNMAHGLVVDPGNKCSPNILKLLRGRSTLNLVRWLTYIVNGLVTSQIHFQYTSNSS